MLPAHAAPPMTRAEYAACQAGDESGFKSAIEAISLKALENATKSIDYSVAVETEWRRLSLDEVLDKRVDLAVEEVRTETSWSDLAQSLVSKEKAQELAVKVAERVYQSETVKQSIESLAVGVGKTVGRTIELATVDATGPAVECLRAFLGARYGATVAGVVTGDVERDFGLDPTKGGAEVSAGTVLSQSGEGITGAAILIVRRQLANMAARIGQRLVGSILSRLVSVAAGGVGLVLIAKDLWELRNGVLPIISEEMKQPATKAKVREEIALALSQQIGEHVREIAAKSAERVLEIWQEFRRAHQKVLALAEQEASFRSFLDTVSADALPRLNEVTAMVLAAEGEAGLMRRLQTGSLNEAVRFMPEPAMMIARDTGSLDAALGWTALAGDQLNKVLEHEIYRRAEPSSFTRVGLVKVLALDDHLAITRLAGLQAETREKLFGLGTDELKRLARTFSEEELSTLASYLTGLGEVPRGRVLEAIATAPGKMQILSSARIRDGVIASPDQTAAVDMMLREGGGGPEVILADFEAASDGRIAPILIWEKHPFIVGGLVLAVLFLLLLMRRLFRPRAKARQETAEPTS